MVKLKGIILSFAALSFCSALYHLLSSGHFDDGAIWFTRTVRSAYFPNLSSNPLPHASIRLEEHANAYEIFRLETWCKTQCQRQFMIALSQKYGCKKIRKLEATGYVEARCDGNPKLTSREVGKLIAKEVHGVSICQSNMELPPVTRGEDIVPNSLTKRLDPIPIVFRQFVQRIRGELPWGLDRIDQNEGEDGKFDLSCFPSLGFRVKMYVLDSGCRTTHEDLRHRAKAVKVGRYTTAEDAHGHGTHVAGIAAGMSHGVCKLCDIICVKTLDETNRGTLLDVVNAVEYVLEQKRKDPKTPAVAVMSLGGRVDTDLLDDAVEKLAAEGIFPAIASGNGYGDACEWSPGRTRSAINVGALKPGDGIRASSNRGECVDLFAPGEGIRSASNQGDDLYISMSGTSMAAPYVAGVAALFLAENPKLRPEEILNEMTLRSKFIQDDRYNTSYPLLHILHENCELYGLSGTRNGTKDGDEAGLNGSNMKGTPSPTTSIVTSLHASPSRTPNSSRIPAPSATPSRTATPSATRSPTISVTPSRTPTPSSTKSPATVVPSTEIGPTMPPLIAPATAPKISPSSMPSRTIPSKEMPIPSPETMLPPSTGPTVSQVSISPQPTVPITLPKTPSVIIAPPLIVPVTPSPSSRITPATTLTPRYPTVSATPRESIPHSISPRTSFHTPTRTPSTTQMRPSISVPPRPIQSSDAISVSTSPSPFRFVAIVLER